MRYRRVTWGSRRATGRPYYYPATADDLFRLVEAVGDASPTPVIIYSTWWEGGLDIDPPLLRRLADLDNVQALKWSAPAIRPVHRRARGRGRPAGRDRQPGDATSGATRLARPGL